MRGFLSQKSGRARVSASVGLSVGISLCAGALIVGPLAPSALASPTVGGDQNGPQVQILQPAYQDVLNGKAKILIGVKTAKFNPQFVEMFVDDKPATPGPISLSALPSAQFDWDTKLFSDGPHKLMVRVTDTQGFRGWAEVNIFINNAKKIDTAPPSLKWQNTTSFQQLSGTASIQLEALDNFGVKWLFISLAKASEPNKKLRSWMLNRPPYNVKLDTTQVPDGLYELSAKAYDSFEQEGDAPTLTLGIVNSAVNATTQADMLEGLKRIQESNRRTLAPAKTVSASVSSAPGSATPRASSSAKTATAKVVAPKTASRIARSLPPASVKTATSAQIGAQPKQTTKASATSKPQVARLAPGVENLDNLEVAAPQFSGSANSEVQPALSSIETEIRSALSEDWRNRLARAEAPDATPRIQVSSVPVWSQNEGDDASRRAALAPLKVELSGGSIAGRSSAPKLLARGEVANDPSVPQISAPRVAPQTKISAREAIGAKLSALKTPRASKAVAPSAPRLAALPRPTKNEARGAINAITVSPLQVNVSQALPAFHVAARSTDLRAVAARYGLPVDVIAANNGWKADKTLAAGERVSLPKQLKVAYCGVPVTGDVPSMLVGGTGVTAFRFMFEKAGGKLSWDAKKQRVVARKGESEVVLSIGSNRAKIGDKDVMMELAAFLFEGRTMVPLRFFEEGLRAQVEWDPQTGRLVVAMAE